MTPADDEVTVVRDRRREFGDRLVRTRVLRVPESEKFPEGLKYALHYGRKARTFRYCATITTTACTSATLERASKQSTFPVLNGCSGDSSTNYRTTSHPNHQPMTTTLHITVESTAEFFESAVSDLRDIDAENPLDDRHVLSLPDEQALARVLSAKNLELLRTIVTDEPESVRDLARQVDRDIKNVSTAVNELEALGLLEFETAGRAKRPVVWYDDIEIDIQLADFGGDDTETAPA